MIITTQKAHNVLKALKSSQSVIKQSMQALSVKDLETIYAKTSEKASGGAGLAKVDFYGKLTFPVISQVELHVGTMRNIYSEVTAEYRVQFGKAFNHVSKEYGEVNHGAFKDCVISILNEKRKEAARAQVEAEIKDGLQNEIMEKAKEIAEQMIRDSQMQSSQMQD